MKLNGKHFFAGFGDLKRFDKPLMNPGDRIKILFDEEDPSLPKRTSIKKGEYEILSVNKNILGVGRHYSILKKGAKHSRNICFITIDKALISGEIIKI